MPYKFKGSRKCTNASGKSGTYVTTKKSGKTTCWKSKAAFERSTAARHAKGMSEQDEEENGEKKRQERSSPFAHRRSHYLVANKDDHRFEEIR